FGMLLVVATIVSVPSGSVMSGSVAFPLPSIATAPAPSIVPPTPSVNVTVPVVIGWPSPVTCTVSVPCQPVAAPVSLTQVVDDEVAGQRTWPLVGPVKVTTGAEPMNTVHGTGSSVVSLPAGSVSVA